MKFYKPIRAALSTLLGLSSPSPPIERRLRVEPELGIFASVESVTDLCTNALEASGAVVRISHANHVEEIELVERLKGRVGGSEMPVWADGSGGAPEFGVCLCRVRDAHYTPEFGAVIMPDGAVLKSSVGEALYLTPNLSELPGVRMVDEAPIMELPANMRAVPTATIFMAWGGRFNYGHFVLDCLSALCVVAEEGLLDRYPAIAPKLMPWHRDLLHLMLGPTASMVLEVDDAVMKVGDALFATPMDHFLHAPSAPLDKVRSRILSRLPVEEAGPPWLYLSRRRDGKRLMLNEIELERRLKELGFEVVHPQDLKVVDQIRMFRDAAVLVGATGAGFANCLFCAPGTKVFEIQPSNYTGIWVRGLCHQVNIDWHGYFAPSPIDDEEASAEADAHPGAMFAWNTPIDDFLTFLSARLDG